MKETLLVVLSLCLAGCSTVRNGGSSAAESMDRAQRARCSTGGVRAPFATQDIVGLAGQYDLYMFAESTGAEAMGRLELHEPPGPTGTEDDPMAGPPPVLLGSTNVEASAVGAVVPGHLTGGEDEAPGVGVYGSPEGSVFIRLGSESNRRDRTRFDGAHTTLRISSIEPSRFGGSWSSADGADSASGDFCAVRSVS